jgi:5-hydroxyisourate hydrolase
LGKLTTHVLDTARGLPAAGLRLTLARLAPEPASLGSFTTNGDGRVDRPLLEGDALRTGSYELSFAAGDYLRATGQPDRFLSEVPIRFLIGDAGAHYHVPLLLSPFGYSTYRGS